MLLDVDGVLANFLGNSLADLAQRHADVPITEDTTPHWDLRKSLPEEGFQRSLREIWERPGWCRGLATYPGAQEGVALLRKHADVHFVTAPLRGARHWMWERQEWLAEHFFAGERDVTFTHAKAYVRGDLLVDDHAENVYQWAAAHPGAHAVLWSHSYNATSEPLQHGNVTRTSRWEDVLGLLRALE